MLIASATYAQTPPTIAPATRPATNPSDPSSGPFIRPSGGMGRASGQIDLNAAKALIGATDEEWKVIGPKLRRYAAARRDAEIDLESEAAIPEPGNMAFDFRGGPGGPGGGGGAFSGPGGAFGPDGGGPGRGGPGGEQGGGFGGGRGRPGGGFGPGDFRPAPTQPGATQDGRPQPPATQPAGDAVVPTPGNPDRNGPAGRRGGGPGGGGRGFGGAGFGGGGFGGGPGGPGGPFGINASAVSRTRSDLRAALADKASTPEQISVLVAGVRKARQKARAEAQTLQRELSELLTPDQEAILVSQDYLD